MTQLIDRIAQIRKDTRRRIEVPEWARPGEPPPVLYFSVLTAADVQETRARMRDVEGRDPDKHQEEERINLLIQKAEFEDGSRAFQWGDRDHLIRNAEYGVLNRLIVFMYRSAFGGESVLDEAEKKSETTAGSTFASPSATASRSRSRKSISSRGTS